MDYCLYGAFRVATGSNCVAISIADLHELDLYTHTFHVHVLPGGTIAIGS